MNDILYGVDLSKKITPLMARDAIFKCFKQAHKEVLDLMDEFSEWKSDEERNKFRDLAIDFQIKNIFKDVGADFDNPAKPDLYKVLDKLAEAGSQFRKPEIVNKHYDEIKKILEKID